MTDLRAKERALAAANARPRPACYEIPAAWLALWWAGKMREGKGDEG